MELWDDASSSAVLECPSVYVKLQDQKNAMAHKVIIPATIARLIAVCKKIFPPSAPSAEIRSVLNQKGFAIESIADIVPGSTIYASEIDPAFQPHDPDAPGTCVVSSSPRVTKSRAKTVTSAATPVRALSKLSIERKPPSEIPKLTVDQLELDLNPSPKSVAFQPGHLIPKSLTKINIRQAKRKQASSDSDDEKPVLRSAASKLAGFMTLARERSDEETDEREIERRRRAERKRHQNSTESSLVLKNEANAPIQQLFEDIVTPADGPRKLEDAIATISRDRVHFIRTSSGSEGEHLALWIRAASDQPFLKRGPQQPHRDPMTQIATAFFERHRFNVGKAVSYRFQGAIVGPRLAGKTTLLSNAFYQFLLELATSGCWKHFFTFGLDLKMLEPKFGNLVDLYHTLLEEVMQACKRQQPVLAEHMIAIRKQLLSVTENRPPLSGLHPYRRVDRIARDLNTAWRNPNGLGDFLTAVFTLPATLPRAFGFKLLAFFVDNIEYGDRPISPSAPFDSAGGFCFPVEHFKQALAQASFLISSESVNSLYHVLAPLEERNVDLRPGLDVITLFEATQDLGSRTRYDYLVEVQGDQIPIRISVDMCGGIPTYLTAWDELNHTLFQLERTPESEARFNERFYEAIADAQRLVDLLFVDLNDKGIIVTSVIRDRRQRS